MTVIVIAGSRRRHPINKLTELFREHTPDAVVHGGEPGTDAAVPAAISRITNRVIKEVVVKRNSLTTDPVHAEMLSLTAQGIGEKIGEDLMCLYFRYPNDDVSRRIAARCEADGMTVELIKPEDN